MNWLKMLSRNKTADDVNRESLVARYKSLREVSQRLNSKFLNLISKNDVHNGGRKLGLLQGDTIVFDAEIESAVLLDYCIHNIRRNGRNAIDRFLIENPPEPDSDEMTCLLAVQNAVYSVFVVESVDRGLGMHVRDLLTDETRLVVDLAMSTTIKPGFVMASRLFLFDDFAMTGGAALPISAAIPDEERDAMVQRIRSALPENCLSDPAQIIRSLLSVGSSKAIAYADAEPGFEQPRIYSKGRANKIGRNDLCPCGSGKKFKLCHGR